MTTQLTARTTAGSRHHRAGAAAPLTATAASAGVGARQETGSTRTAAGVRGRALLAALGLALAAAVLPATAVHASPQSPDVENQFANPGGNPQPPEPPQWGPQDLAPPTEHPEPPLPPEPPDAPDWGPDDVANPTENPEPEPPEPPVGPDDLANPTENPEPTNPTGDPDPSGDSIPTPERVDAGFGGAALGSHQAAGLALIAAAVVLALLVVVLARRHRAEARSAR